MKSWPWLMLVLCVFIGCEEKQQGGSSAITVTFSVRGQTKEKEEVEYPLKGIETVGSHSYIPIGLAGDPHEWVTEILTLIHQFKEKHPEWEITNWKIEKQQDAHGVSAKIFGLWVDHQPRQGYTPQAEKE